MSHAPVNTPETWLLSLAESEAQLAAGQTVPAAPALERLRASIARLEAEANGGKRREIALWL